MIELKEFTDAVEKEAAEQNIDDDQAETVLKKALQALLHHQCIYSFSPNQRSLYECLHRHFIFLRKYFAALNIEVVHLPQERMIALFSHKIPHPTNRNTLRKDETAVLLCLRLLFNEARELGNVNEYGVAEATSDDLVDRLQDAAGISPPSDNRLKQIIDKFRKSGMMRHLADDKDETFIIFEILPGVQHVTPDVTIEHIRQWAITGSYQGDHQEEQVTAIEIGENTNV